MEKKSILVVLPCVECGGNHTFHFLGGGWVKALKKAIRLLDWAHWLPPESE
jgi:hypothetical protein